MTFWTTFAPKKAFPIENKKSEHRLWILHIRIRLASKFTFKLTILTFWTKFFQKKAFLIGNKKNCKYCQLGPNFPKNGVSGQKRKKVNSITEFGIFELVLISSFTLSYQFLFFGPQCPKQGISGWTQKKRTSPLNSAYSN